MDEWYIVAAPALGTILVLGGLVFFWVQRTSRGMRGKTTVKFKDIEVTTDYPSVVAVLLGAFLVCFPGTPLCQRRPIVAAVTKPGPDSQMAEVRHIQGKVNVLGRSSADTARVYIVTEANIPLVGSKGTYEIDVPAGFKSYQGIAYITDASVQKVFTGPVSWSDDRKAGKFDVEFDLADSAPNGGRVASATSFGDGGER
jgi:hypothetical protein